MRDDKKLVSICHMSIDQAIPTALPLECPVRCQRYSLSTQAILHWIYLSLIFQRALCFISAICCYRSISPFLRSPPWRLIFRDYIYTGSLPSGFHLCVSRGSPSRISECKERLRSECVFPRFPPCPVPVSQLLPSSEGPRSCQVLSLPSYSLGFW